ncbi:hypothetical protein OG393_29075 [Streptomyces sp. NBC_01216]|uniref:hypothetical protein n=1 Tax=Streptomyces sp. NBC_01216 TaxID=2903778 RepID=UPI002E0F564A|nr:hypothetical protein OG393_29075 [Streptomyces sp. NBC_01216]
MERIAEDSPRKGFRISRFAREYAERSPHTYGGGEFGTYGMWDMRGSAESLTVAKGFGLIEDADGAPLSDWDSRGYYGCDCTERTNRVNAEVAHAAFEAAGVEHWEWRGMIAFDAGDIRGLRIARQISDCLAGWSILDDDRHSELEWDDACKMIEDQYTLPEGVEAGDVINKMPEVPHCSNCSSCDVDDAMEALGYLQCQDCDTWLKTETEGAMCRDCTEREEEGECTCVASYVDTLKHTGTYATMADVRTIQRSCDTCYPEIWPHVSLTLAG